MTLPVSILSLLLPLTVGSPAVGAEHGELVLRVCEIELTEAGRRARFSFHYFYTLRTGDGGEVVAIERRTEREPPPFVREEAFEPCLHTWRLRPNSEYGVVLSVDTSAAHDTITVQRADELHLRLLVPK